MSTVHSSLARNPGPLPFPQKKNIEFAIGGDAISRCFEGLTCTLKSLLSRSSIITVTFLLPPSPLYFYGNLDETYFLKVVRYVHPNTPVAVPMRRTRTVALMLQYCVRLSVVCIVRIVSTGASCRKTV